MLIRSHEQTTTLLKSRSILEKLPVMIFNVVKVLILCKEMKLDFGSGVCVSQLAQTFSPFAALANKEGETVMGAEVKRREAAGINCLSIEFVHIRYVNWLQLGLRSSRAELDPRVWKSCTSHELGRVRGSMCRGFLAAVHIANVKFKL